MWVKAFDGFIETIGGLLLLFTSSATIDALVRFLTKREFGEDPYDAVANFILSAGHKLGEARLFGSLYLISHGALKIIIVYYLLKKDTRVYPWAITFLILFTIYQLYVTLHDHSLPYLVLAFLDAVIVFIVWREYTHLSALQA